MLNIKYKEPNKKVSELTVQELIELIDIVIKSNKDRIYDYNTGYFIKPYPNTNEIYCRDYKVDVEG